MEPGELLAYMRMVSDRRWLVAALFVLTVGAAALFCLAAEPQYEARAQLLLEPEQPNVVSFQEVIEEQASKTDYYQTQYEVLHSRTLARATLEQLKMWNQPQFTYSEGRLARLLNGARVLAGLQQETTVSSAAADETAAQSRAINIFLEGLTIEPVRSSRLVNVRFNSSDAKLAAMIVNTLVRAYIDRTLEFKLSASREALAWLDTRLAQQRRAVERSETALQRYRVENQGLSIEERQNIIAQRLEGLNAAVTRARADRIEKESLYEQLDRAHQERGPSDALPAGIATAALDELRRQLAEAQARQIDLAQQLGDKHPELITGRARITDLQMRVDRELDAHLAGAWRGVLAARSTEQQLASALEAQKAEALALDQDRIQYGALQREANSNRQVFEAVLQRAKETAVAGELKTSNIRIIDEADVPLSPVFPRTKLVLALGVFAGAGLGIGVALLLGFFDDGIKSPAAIRRHFDLPFLGSAPSVPRRGGRSELLLHNGAPAEYGEALRIVRTNLAFYCEDQKPRVLLVTSAVRGEGKTLLATNLGLALAQTRQRVLLVDGDMRRPRLHTIFEGSRAPGLSDVIKSQNIDGAIRDTAVGGLKLMPAGTETRNPADLLGFDSVAALLSRLGTHFDWIVVDTPPVGEVTDACLLAHSPARVVFVAAADVATHSSVRTALEQLEAADAAFAGVVLNRAKSKSRYYTIT